MTVLSTILLSRGSQNSHVTRFGSISIPKIRSTPNSKWSSLQVIRLLNSWAIQFNFLVQMASRKTNINYFMLHFEKIFYLYIYTM